MLTHLTGIIRQPASRPWSRKRVWAIASGITFVAGLTFAYALGLLPRAASTTTVDASAGQPALTSVVKLSPTKVAAAHIHVSPVQMQTLQETRRVPGKIGYNSSRRLEVKMPVGGVVVRVMAQPGQRVKQGDVLAYLSSVEVGLARDEVVKAEADAELARKERDWAVQIADNLELLLKQLQAQPSAEEVEKQFSGKVLGNHRDKVLSAYSKQLLAARTAEASETLGSRGALSDMTIRERRSNHEVANAYFESVCEQSRFDAMQQRAKAQAAFEHAERLVGVSRQQLQLLRGPFAEIAESPKDSALCELLLRASMDGQVEERRVTDGSQFAASQILFVLANTDTLWVSAQLYEREWAELSQSPVRELSVDTPAVPGHPVQAKMMFVSVGMSAETRAVPLVAELANADGRLKPGMFAWVSVPIGAAREVLAVPESAVTRHEQRAFVFVEDEPGVYRKVDVTLGIETAEFVEIKHGLEPGQSVVDSGAFFLKSELLLQGEND